MHPELPADADRRGAASGRTCGAAYERGRPRRRDHRPQARPPRHGLRRQQRARARRHRAPRPLPPPATPGRGARCTQRWFRAHGFDVRRAEHVHEGEGDFALVRRRDPRRHRLPHRPSPRTAKSADVFGREVVTLELVDPRFYHLDTALFALDAEQIAYFPGAFSDDEPRRARDGATPTRSIVDRARRARVRLQRDQRRAQRVPARGRRRPRGRARGARLRPVAARSVRAAQGRRQREVLHARTARRRRCA